MLPKFFEKIDSSSEIKIRKFRGSEDVSDFGAFRYGDKINIEVSLARRFGAAAIVLRICRDGAEEQDIPFTLLDSDNIHDVYAYTLDTASICGDGTSGLFYYEFLIVRGNETLFTDTINNKDFELINHPGARFRMLVFERDFDTPNKFGRGVMYQIFTDRFFRGESEESRAIAVRDDAILNPDWENGVPQFAEYPGAPLKNNMFFGGNLWGVAEKLDYLKSLGVTYIYLCPRFKAYSNHKYDTGDYSVIDEMLGGEEAFDNLIAKAKKKGIGIILDGVFNHTGDDSLYFNRYKKYGEGGAYNDYFSEYRDWFCFRSYPEEFESWWGIKILPKLNHSNENCRRFFTGEGGIIEKYIKRGIAGWRLDVADELSDDFLDELRTSAKKSSDGQAVIIGEVWENAADKVAYGKRRRYFLGRQLDSVMNYPVKNAILDFCIYGDAEMLYDTLVEIYSSYPRCVCHKLMNLIGTHDTQRVLTVLGKSEFDGDAPNNVLAYKRLDGDQRKVAIERLKIAAALQFTVYGIPSVYYGDEVGLEGYGDPFCRMPFPWHEIDAGYRRELLEYYRVLGKIREREEAFDGGSFYVIDHSDKYIVYAREKNDSRIVIAANRGEDITLTIPQGILYKDLLNGKIYRGTVIIKENSSEIFKAISDTKEVNR